MVLLTPLWLSVGDFRVGTDPAGLIEGDAHKRAVYEKAERYLPEDEEILLINLRCEDVFTNRILGLMREIGEAFLDQPDVAGVKSFTHSYLPVRDGMSVDFKPFVPGGELSSEELDALREFSMSHPIVRNVMVSSDARNALITVDYRREFPDHESRRAFRDEVESVLAPFRRDDVDFQVLAVPLIREELEAALRNDFLLFVPAAVAILFVLLKTAFPSWRLLLFVLIGSAVYLSLLPGLFLATGLEVDAFAIALFPLLAGIQLTLLAHISSAFQVALRDGENGMSAARKMLQQVTRSCLFACLTTAMGLLALLACDVEALKVFGMLGACGVAAAFLLAFGPAIALLRVLFPDGRGRDSHAVQKSITATEWQRNGCRYLAAWVDRRRRVLLTAGALALAVSLPGLFYLETDIRVTEFLEPGSPTREMVETLDRAYGGINLLRLELDSGEAGGIDTPGFLRFVWSVQEYANHRDQVSGAYSYALLMALLNQVWDGGEAAALTVPESQARIQFFSGAMRAQERNLPLLGALSDDGRRTAYVMVRTPDLPSGEYLRLIEDVVDFAASEKPEAAEVSAAEGIHTILEAERRILRGQLHSAWLSIGAIGVLLLLLWRSVRLALLGVLAAAFPVTLVLGLAGYAGIALNSATIMMAAIVLGVTVDDAVHFVTYWIQARKRQPAGALERTFIVKGPPVICTTLVLIAIFYLFATASFPPVRHFGIMAATAFLLTLASVLLCLPAFLTQRK